MKKSLCFLAVFAASWLLPGSASAATMLSCPDAADPIDETRIYTVGADDVETSVIECVYGDGNINGADNDAFLGDDGGVSQFDGDPWTSFCSTGSNTGPGECTDPFGEPGDDDFSTVDDFQFEILDGFNSWFSFQGDTDYEYALGLKDGGAPKWSVFLLSDPDADGFYYGNWTITTINPQGTRSNDPSAISHFAVYDRFVGNGGPGGPDPGAGGIPEPGLLTLLGAGLVGVSLRLRRRK